MSVLRVLYGLAPGQKKFLTTGKIVCRYIAFGVVRAKTLWGKSASGIAANPPALD